MLLMLLLTIVYGAETVSEQAAQATAKSQQEQARSDANAKQIEEAGFWTPLLMSVVAGAATSLGAGVVYIMETLPTPGQMAGSLGLAAGVMLTVSIFDLWLPICYEYGWVSGCSSLGCGVVVFLVLEWVVDKVGLGEPEMLPVHTPGDDRKVGNSDKQKKWRLGMLMMVTLTIHNFPEGLAVVVSALSSQKLGIIMCVAIGLHNIPEGLTIATPIYAATGDRWHAFLMASASGLSEPLGALTALLFLRPYMINNPNIVGYAMCGVGGIMTAVSLKELIPEGLNYNEPRHFWAGMVLGAAVMALTLYFDV